MLTAALAVTACSGRSAPSHALPDMHQPCLFFSTQELDSLRLQAGDPTSTRSLDPGESTCLFSSQEQADEQVSEVFVDFRNVSAERYAGLEGLRPTAGLAGYGLPTSHYTLVAGRGFYRREWQDGFWLHCDTLFAAGASWSVEVNVYVRRGASYDGTAPCRLATSVSAVVEAEIPPTPASS